MPHKKIATLFLSVRFAISTCAVRFSWLEYGGRFANS